MLTFVTFTARLIGIPVGLYLGAKFMSSDLFGEICLALRKKTTR